jgi:hypothetical protein
LGPQGSAARDHRAGAHHHQAGRNPRRGAALGRSRRGAGRAGAGHRAAEDLAEPARQRRPGEPHDLLRLRRRLTGARLIRREGQEPLRRRARAPGGQRRDQPAGDPARRDARPGGSGRHRSRRPFVNGYKKAFDNISPPDIAKAKGLLTAAGYPNGFSVTLHCPNDRYLNDEAICQAAVGMLGQIGIKINLVSQSKSLHFPTLQNLKSDFYLLGWGVPTYDSDYIFSYLYHTRTGTYGGWNMTRYSNPESTS